MGAQKDKSPIQVTRRFEGDERHCSDGNAKSGELIKNTDKNTTAIMSYVCLVNRMQTVKVVNRNFQKIVKKK